MHEAISLAARLRPTVVLMDVRMPGLDGLAAARVIVADTASRVLMLTTFDSDEYVYTALRAGASGFLLKDTPSQHLVTAVRSVAAGDALIDPVITLAYRAVRARHPPQPTAPEQLAALTPRERDVLRHIAQGLSNAEIARQLTVEENTVKTHVGRILTKLGLRDRVQAVVLAYETGFVVPDRLLSRRRPARKRSGPPDVQDRLRQRLRSWPSWPRLAAAAASAGRGRIVQGGH